MQELRAVWAVVREASFGADQEGKKAAWVRQLRERLRDFSDKQLRGELTQVRVQIIRHDMRALIL